MKSFATAAIGALCIAQAEARQWHTHSHPHALKRVSEMKQHLEMVYGRGLIGLYNENGALEITPDKMKAARRRPAQNYGKIGGLMMNQETAVTGLYGFVEGFQYKGLAGAAEELMAGEMVESNCFYAMYGLADSFDVLLSDLSNFIDPAGEIKWLNFIMYNPSHIINNVMVGYEMCEGFTQIERVMGMFSLDFALMSQSLGTDFIYILTEYKPRLMKLLEFAKPCLESAAQAGLEVAMDTGKDMLEDEINKFDNVSFRTLFAKYDPFDFIDPAACQPNYYEVGKISGEMVSRLLMQKLEESRLP